MLDEPGNISFSTERFRDLNGKPGSEFSALYEEMLFGERRQNELGIHYDLDLGLLNKRTYVLEKRLPDMNERITFSLTPAAIEDLSNERFLKGKIELRARSINRRWLDSFWSQYHNAVRLKIGDPHLEFSSRSELGDFFGGIDEIIGVEFSVSTDENQYIKSAFDASFDFFQIDPLIYWNDMFERK